MHSMNKVTEVDVSVSGSPKWWRSQQYDNEIVWLGVIITSDFKYYAKLIEKGSNKELLEDLKDVYW